VQTLLYAPSAPVYCAVAAIDHATTYLACCVHTLD